MGRCAAPRGGPSFNKKHGICPQANIGFETFRWAPASPPRTREHALILVPARAECQHLQGLQRLQPPPCAALLARWWCARWAPSRCSCKRLKAVRASSARNSSSWPTTSGPTTPVDGDTVQIGRCTLNVRHSRPHTGPSGVPVAAGVASLRGRCAVRRRHWAH